MRTLISVVGRRPAAYRQLPTLLALALALAALVTLAGMSGAGCTSDQERLRAHRQRAERYRAESRYGEALIELRNALALDPRSPDTNFEIAEVLGAQGRIGQALYYYAETRRLDPAKVEAHLAEARWLLRVDPGRAIELIEEAIDMQPMNATARVRLSEARLARGDSAEGLDAARAAAELARDAPEVEHQLGVAYLARAIERERRALPFEAELLEHSVAALERAAALEDEASRWRSLVTRATALAAWPARAAEAADAYFEAVQAAAASPEAGHSLAAARVAAAYAASIGDDALRRRFLRLVIDADSPDIGPWLELALLEQESGGSGDAVFAELLGQRPQDPDARAAYARWLLEQGRGAEASAQLEQALAAGVPAATLLGALLVVYSRLGQHEALQKTIERILKEHPDHAVARQARALQALSRDQPAAAAATLRELAGESRNASIERLLAEAELRLGNLEAATAAIDRALELSSASRSAELALKARIRHAAGDCYSTLVVLAELARAALDAEQQLMLARCLYETGQASTGREILTRLVAGPRPEVPALLEFAVREHAGDPRGARDLLERQFALRPGEVGLLRALTLLDLATHEPARALARLEAVIAKAGARPDLLVTRAWVVRSMGRLDEAERDAHRALELAPGNRAALAVLTAVLRAAGRADDAIELLRGSDLANRPLLPGNRVLLAWLLMARGDEQEAIEEFEQLLTAEASFPFAKADLAMLLARQGKDPERAQRLAEEALDAQPDEPAALDALGYVLLRRGLAEAAVEQLGSAVRLAQSRGSVSASYHYHLGLALRMVRRNRSALQAFERALELDPDFPEAARAHRERERALANAPFSLDEP